MQPCAPENLHRRFTRARRGWLIPVALLALTPKCILCVLTYAGISTLLGLSGPELCGTTNNTTGHWIPGVLVLAGIMAAVIKLRLPP